MSVTGGGQYTALISWTKADGSALDPGDFLPSTAYQAKVRLTAASGYVFGPPSKMKFFHPGGDPVTDGAASSLVFRELTPAGKVGEVTIVFPATTAMKAVPVTDMDLTGKVPVPIEGGTPGQYLSTPQYTGTIHTGKDGIVTPNPANAAGSGTVTIKFPATIPGP